MSNHIDCINKKVDCGHIHDICEICKLAYQKGKIDALNEAFEIVLEDEHQITSFADKIGIKILKKKNQLLKEADINE